MATMHWTNADLHSDAPRLRVAILCLCMTQLATLTLGAESDFTSDVEPLLRKHCIGCHSRDDPGGDLVLETWDQLMAGGEHGPPVVPGKSAESLLLRVITGESRPKMPPGRRPPPSAAEVETLRRWIDAGAQKGSGRSRPVLEDIAPVPLLGEAVLPVTGLAFSPDGRHLAVLRRHSMEFVDARTLAPGSRREVSVESLSALAYSRDGKFLIAAGGTPGLRGDVRIWRVRNGKLYGKLAGHDDAIHSLAISPDGERFATGSYDRTIIVHERRSRQALHRLSGHDGAVFALAWRSDGRVLASASADRTVKLWSVERGERLDTFSESSQGLHALAFSPDGRSLAAGGADRRIRVWRLSDEAVEGQNDIVHSRFAHEGEVLALAWSHDGEHLLSAASDRSVKLWRSDTLTEIYVSADLPDWPSCLAFSPDSSSWAVGCLDSSVHLFETATGAPLSEPTPSIEEAAPVTAETAAKIRDFAPRGIQMGTRSRVTVRGEHLGSIEFAESLDPRVWTQIDSSHRSGDSIDILVQAEDGMDRGAVRLALRGSGGFRHELELQVDDLALARESDATYPNTSPQLLELPVQAWGEIRAAGESDAYRISAAAGAEIVLDLAAERIGSKLDAVLSLYDAEKRLIASSNDFDSSIDPFLTHRVTESGELVVQVSDTRVREGSDRFYRLTAGELPYALSSFPLLVAENSAASIRLLGPNLGPSSRVQFAPSSAGRHPLPLDTARIRMRRALEVLVESGPVISEPAEPDGEVASARQAAAPFVFNGRFDARLETPEAVTPEAETEADTDHVRFESKAGEVWSISTEAARHGSPADTRIEVLDAAGQPIERVLLQATRDSAINFRPISSRGRGVRIDNWEEMHLRQYVWLEGDVARIYRMPQGPDSDLQFWPSDDTSRRRAYFGSTPTAHALDTPCYIVEPHPPGSELVPTGLPIFSVDYENDDDPRGRDGTDSRLLFRAPSDGAYVVRVEETGGRGGPLYRYLLRVRRARPDFEVSLTGFPQNLARGSGQAFTVVLRRQDKFDGPVLLAVEGAPPGMTISSPILVEAGHDRASGCVYAAEDASPWDSSDLEGLRWTASATIDGVPVERPVRGLPKTLQLNEAPPLRVFLAPVIDAAAPSPGVEGGETGAITIHPGERVRALLRVERRSHEGLVSFDLDNLPHGVIVDFIGLNGVLLPADVDEREIFLHCEPWVAETDRLCHARAKQAGSPASAPVLLRVRQRADR